MQRRRPDPRVVAPRPNDDDRSSAMALVPVSRETEERLALFVDRLRRWQSIKNLVGSATLDAVWTRHVADSAQLLALAPQAVRWVDLGSGAGFPGLVIAIMLAGVSGARVDLIESNHRKCAFLREVVRDTEAPALVHAGRIEAVVPLLADAVDVVTARAVASIPHLVALAEPLLVAGALGLFLGGGSFAGGAGEHDLLDASQWSVVTSESKTQSGSRIVMVRRCRTWDNGDVESDRGGVV